MKRKSFAKPPKGISRQAKVLWQITSKFTRRWFYFDNKRVRDDVDAAFRKAQVGHNPAKAREELMNTKSGLSRDWFGPNP